QEDNVAGVLAGALGGDGRRRLTHCRSLDSERITAIHRLLILELSRRRVQIAGIARRPDGLWMAQIARNLADATDGLLSHKRFLLHDRDPLFTQEFEAILA